MGMIMIEKECGGKCPIPGSMSISRRESELTLLQSFLSTDEGSKSDCKQESTLPISILNSASKIERTSQNFTEKDNSDVSWDILDDCGEDLTVSASSSPQPTETDSIQELLLCHFSSKPEAKNIKTKRKKQKS